MIGKELTSNELVRMLSFTGSTEIGRQLMAQSATTVKKLGLELGGNAPFIVFDDADLDKAVQGAIAWIEQRMQASPTGFLDYARGEKTGLVNQAWKDSHDSMFHADGSFPRGPLAVVEEGDHVPVAEKAVCLVGQNLH